MKAYFRCDRGGKIENKKHDRKRKHTATRLIDCLFSCFAVNKVNEGWVLIVRDSFHNHESISEGFHSSFRKLAMIKKIMIFINTQFRAQATFFQIISSLRLEDDDCIFKIKDSYNVKQAIRFKNLDFLFFMQFLLRNLKRNN